MHGDIAVSKAGEVYVSVETAGMGVQVFSPDGRYFRKPRERPADLHGFVIRDAGDGEHIYGVSLRGQKFVKLTLGGDVVLEIARDAIPREYWTPNRFATELGVLLSGMDVAPNGDLYVTDGYSSDYVHRFDARGRYLGSFGGKAAPYGFNILHKIAMDTRFDPVRIIATDRLNNRVVHLALDGDVPRRRQRRAAAARRAHDRRRQRDRRRAQRASDDSRQGRQRRSRTSAPTPPKASARIACRPSNGARATSSRRTVWRRMPTAIFSSRSSAPSAACTSSRGADVSRTDACGPGGRSTGAAAGTLRGRERIEADVSAAKQIAM